MVDQREPAARYYTDGWFDYINVVYLGQYAGNARDRSDTFTLEGVNADMRRDVSLLARRSRCFARTLETLKAVIKVFVSAYNRFGQAKHRYRLPHRPKRDLHFALVNFLGARLDTPLGREALTQEKGLCNMSMFILYLMHCVHINIQ